MTENPIDRRGIQDLATAHPEVEFALVLARTIDSLQADPEQLRGAIYELARQKLREQFTHEDAKEIARLTSALEVAILGVEAHSKKEAPLRPAVGFDARLTARATRLSATEYPAGQILKVPVDPLIVEQGATQIERPWLAGSTNSERLPASKWARFSLPWRFALVMVIAMTIGAVILQRSGYFHRANRTAEPAVTTRETAVASNVRSDRVATPPLADPPKFNPLIPTTYGVYAVSAGKLHELDSLQFRAPDIRVAVSAVITTASRAIVPDGHVKFVVYRRDAASSAPEAPDVRIVAKIEQAVDFDSAGKPVTTKTEENWVVRNISYPYRTAPVKDNQEMYEVQSKDADFELAPGRYVLVIKGQAFDFAVAGASTDSRQCLQRVSAANGTFYSACQK